MGRCEKLCIKTSKSVFTKSRSYLRICRQIDSVVDGSRVGGAQSEVGVRCSQGPDIAGSAPSRAAACRLIVMVSEVKGRSDHGCWETWAPGKGTLLCLTLINCSWRLHPAQKIVKGPLRVQLAVVIVIEVQMGLQRRSKNQGGNGSKGMAPKILVEEEKMLYTNCILYEPPHTALYHWMKVIGKPLNSSVLCNVKKLHVQRVHKEKAKPHEREIHLKHHRKSWVLAKWSGMQVSLLASARLSHAHRVTLITMCSFALSNCSWPAPML